MLIFILNTKLLPIMVKLIQFFIHEKYTSYTVTKWPLYAQWSNAKSTKLRTCN